MARADRRGRLTDWTPAERRALARFRTPGAVQAFLDSLRRSPPAPGVDKVRIAGEPERESRARREREGIPVDDATWKEIRAAAAKVKLDPARVDQIAAGK